MRLKCGARLPYSLVSEAMAGPCFEHPPGYRTVDPLATRFTIYGTIIDTPSGPAYQLSDFLDTCSTRLRMRRLHSHDVSQLQTCPGNIAFDNRATLYEMCNESSRYYITGKCEGTLPGMSVLQFGYFKWYVQHVHNGVASPLMSCGKSTMLHAIRNPRDETTTSIWRDKHGIPVAAEVLKFDRYGKRMPVIELTNGLAEPDKELLLALWVCRLWATFGGR